MRLALVADWLTTFGGAEHAIAEFRANWPEAPLFTTVKNTERIGALGNNLSSTKLQTLYRLLGRHEPLLPFFPRAIESIDLTGFDVVLSSSHAIGKGVIPPATAVHVCYCHTPMRYAWEMEQQYLKDFHVPNVLIKRVRRLLSWLRRWDLSTAKRVDLFIANSTETQRRIERVYGRESIVLPPPVSERLFDTPLKSAAERKGFLAVGRLVPYKRVDLLIDWANATKSPLRIAGRGSEEARLKKRAGPTVEFLGHVSEADLPNLYASAKALLFAPHEDAGIVPMEAQACGTPVIAYGKGGVLDTVRDSETGVLFEEQTVPSIQEAVARFERMTFDPLVIREHAKKFSAATFRKKMEQIVNDAWKKFGTRK